MNGSEADALGSVGVRDRIAIITGAGSRGDGIGIGRAISLLLARQQASVVLVDNHAEWLEVTRSMVGADGGRAIACLADVTDPAACRAVVRRASDEFGRVDILVNSVGIVGPVGTAVDVDPNEWDAAMRVNVTSMMLMARAAIPAMVASGGGSIVNIASVSGLLGGHPNLFYPASKGAVVNMTRAMAVHHGRQGIRVNCVAPGMVHTPLVEARGMTDELRAARREANLLGTEGTAWDVAHAVAFLASDAARWVTGTVLPIDGGASAASLNKPSPR